MKEWFRRASLSGGGRVFGFALGMALFNDFSLLIPAAIFCELIMATIAGLFWKGGDAQ